MLEKEIEGKVCDYARRRGVLSRKFTSPSHRSVPDRIFIYQGQCWFVEFKRLGVKPTLAQLHEHSLLKSQGMQVFVIDSVAAGDDLIDRLVAND